jgi:Mrp family chromosome partitioning ATPase
VGEIFSNRPATLADYLAILRRRKWIIIALPVMAAIVAYAVSTTQSPRYEAKATVVFNLSSITAELANISPDLGIGDPTRYMATQAKIARSPDLARRVADDAGVSGVGPGEFLGNSNAEADTEANVLKLSASAADPGDAVRLVNTYADDFTRYKTERDTKPINDQISRYQARIAALRARGETGSADALFQKKLDLETLGEQLANNASPLEPAAHASKTRPLSRRNAIIGGLLGAFLGLGLAFLAEALDKRVRSEEEIESTLGLPLLGRLPRPGRRLRKANKLVMLAEPRSIHAETFRKLRTSLEFVNFDRGARTIMVTSAGAREGKTTTVANLGVALARAGRRVALVDLDLRRPFLHVFFHIRDDHGVTDVVVNRVDLDSAMRLIAVPAAPAPAQWNGRPATASNETASNGRADTDSVVHVLPCGTIPPAADEFLESERITGVIDELSKQFDVVLVDAPPLLAVGDAMTLSRIVDGIVLVTHLGIHRRQLQEFARQLQNCRAALLGFVVTGVSHGDSYSYGYGYDPHVYDVRHEAERRRQRV